MKKVLLFAAIVFASSGLNVASAQQPAYDLIQLINKYRAQAGLPAIPASAKLNQVAVAHVRDLANFQPHKQNGNLHSWSKNGPWKGGPYDSSNSATWPIMWNKPKEIAGYPSHGFEIAASGVVNAQDALQSWQGSAAHRAVLLNQGPWQNYQWKAVGAAVYKGYACVWFGTTPDGSHNVLRIEGFDRVRTLDREYERVDPRLLRRR